MRNLSPAMLAAAQSNNILPAILMTATFQTGPVYLWSGFGTLQWNGFAWQGIGSMGTVSTIEEGNNVQARGVTLTLSGFDANLVNLVLTELKLGAPVTLYVGLFGGEPLALLADPYVIWAGRTDQPKIDVSGTTATITIACESRLLDMNLSVERRLTNDDQRLDYPQDRGLEFVYSIVETQIYWGAKPTLIANQPNVNR